MEIIECDGVYPPSEDTFFLLEGTLQEIKKIKESRNIDGENLCILEIGSGTGYIAIYLAKMGFHVVATDISLKFIECIKLNSKLNNVRLDIRKGSLFDPIAPDEVFDLIIFNPPYIESDEFSQYLDSDLILAVHADGSIEKLLTEFVEQAMKHIRLNGRILFLLESSLYKRILDTLLLYSAQILKIKHLPLEKLLLVRILRSSIYCNQ